MHGDRQRYRYTGIRTKKRDAGTGRTSKGLELLHKKIESLNHLYDLSLTLSVQDLSETDTTQTGTCITLTYLPHKIWKTKSINPVSPPAS
ncbi:MAG: hypothetical protein IPM98_02545 [Lewinellaceae bacterium]|nr:hypothetical protein [Lewinellaceae bacterium]